MFASKEKEKNAVAQLIYFVSLTIWFYEADCGDGEKVCQKGRGNFTNDEKRQLSELVQRYKVVVKSEGKTKFDRWRGKHVPDLP